MIFPLAIFIFIVLYYYNERAQTMATYQIPQIPSPLAVSPNEAFLIASGDLRLSANQTCWPAQAEMEQQITSAFATMGITVKRAHPYDDALKHGFIWNQRMGMDVFKSIPPDAPLIVAVAVWQNSYPVLPGVKGHRGPIFTIPKWSGQWAGLEGTLDFKGSLSQK